MSELRRLWKATLTLGAIAALGACMTTTPNGFMSDGTGSGAPGIDQKLYTDVCGRVRPGGGGFRCHAKVVINPDGTVKAAATPQGYGPPDLRSAYGLPASGGSGRTIAIVDANDDPTAESDLGVYRSTYGLPACTTANGCFKKVNQSGQASPLPATDTGWAGEISLDLDMASAACPDCKILLVEANSATDADLGTAVNTAASLGASAISNSYGGGEDSSVTAASSQYYDHPGILVTASSGDQAYGAEFPATSQYVLAVGGTTLSKASNTRGWTESAWNSGGSGCSAYIAKPSWQKDTAARCAPRRTSRPSATRTPASPCTRPPARAGGRSTADERGVAPRGEHLHAPQPRRGRAVVGLLAHVGLLRRDLRQQRQLQPVVPVHRGHRLRRPDGLGHSERRSALRIRRWIEQQQR